MKKIVILFTMIFLLFYQIPVHGEDKIIFGSFFIPGMVETKDKGVFIDLTKAVAKRAGINIEINVTPPKRAMRYFLDGHTDVLFPAVDNKFPPGKLPVRSAEAIFVKKTFIFSLKEKQLFRSVKDLEGNTVGITMGYSYPKELTGNNRIRIFSDYDDKTNAVKLVRGITEAFVAEENSGLKAFDSINSADRIHYDITSPISTEDVYYAFQQSAKGKELAKKISYILISMKKDGSFGHIIKNNRNGNKK